MCDKSAEALSANAPSRVDDGAHIDPSAQRVYLINCLYSIQVRSGLGRPDLFEMLETPLVFSGSRSESL
jgi:hypothetical protein